MRRSKTLARIRAGHTARICGLGQFIPSFICHAAHFGYDCIWLDNEHRDMSTRDLQTLLALFHHYDVDCMLRPPTTERTRLYRYLEDGATGLMIPHVATEEKARALAQAVKFPPIGDRGLDGAGFDANYLLHGDEDYPAWANRETFLVVQIESPQAVQNVDAIAAVEGLDGLFIGPGDLQLRLDHDPGGMTLDEAVSLVAASAARHGKAWGMPVATPEELRRRREQGAQLLAHGNVFMALMKMLEESAGAFESVSS